MLVMVASTVASGSSVTPSKSEQEGERRCAARAVSAVIPAERPPVPPRTTVRWRLECVDLEDAYGFCQLPDRLRSHRERQQGLSSRTRDLPRFFGPRLA
jgi:hypothetical protein